MKYVLNTGRYARAYEIVTKDGHTKLIKLERRRLYLDTGNVAMTGITPVEDEDYKLLEANKAYKRDSKNPNFGLSLVDEATAMGEPDPQASKIAKENKELKKELAQAKKAIEESEDAKAMKKLAEENATLKAQLEALKQPKADADEEKAEDEGF